MNEFIFKSTPEIDRILKEMIGNRIEKIVRCKDCKYWRKDFIPKRSLADDVGHSACMRLNGIILMDADDFCSRGERKDG